METEIWKDIPGYEWLYMVSNMGEILSKWQEPFVWSRWRIAKWRRPLLMKGQYVRGYKKVTLYLNKDKRQCLVHRLVASAFLWLDLNSFTDRKISLRVCHKDDNPSNNRVENLFLWTAKDNSMDMVKKWRCRPNKRCWIHHHLYWKKWKLHNTSKPIIQLSKYDEVIRYWDSWLHASQELWICNTWISRCCTWKQKLYCWYKWKFKI